MKISIPGRIAFLVLLTIAAILETGCGAGATAPPQTSSTSSGASSHSVDLSWNPSTSLVQGYFVYRSGTSGSGYSRVSALVGPLLFTDTNVQAGKTYYYVVTALGADGTESPYSNEASATIPSP